MLTNNFLISISITQNSSPILVSFSFLDFCFFVVRDVFGFLPAIRLILRLHYTRCFPRYNFEADMKSNWN